MAKKEVKVKSHSRRSKDGKQVRVKEGRRKSLGKKLAVAGGVTATVAAGAYGLKKHKDFKHADSLIKIAKTKHRSGTKGSKAFNKIDRKEILNVARQLKSAKPFFGKVKVITNKAKTIKETEEFLKWLAE
jgi:hypothetical protein